MLQSIQTRLSIRPPPAGSMKAEMLETDQVGAE